VFHYVINSNGQIRQKLQHPPSAKVAASALVVTDERDLSLKDWRWDRATGVFVRFRARSSDAPAPGPAELQRVKDLADLQHHIGLVQDSAARDALTVMARLLGL
jgi:hypothetical protein